MLHHAAQPAFAQAVYGTIIGTVTDPTGAAIPGATVTILDTAKGTSNTVQTNESGEYAAPHLIPDVYDVQAAASGFTTSSVRGVRVFADTTPKVDVHLAITSSNTSITVTDAPAVLQTERADVSTILNERALGNLPNFNRNFTAFELLTPGTTYIGWNVGESSNPQRSQQIEVNGQLPFATGYELDGTDNQDPVTGVAVINPNLDAVSEMKVTSQNYDAEFGKAVAGLVTAQTKSGGNSFHGSAFWFRRSDAQQARDPFSQYQRDTVTGKFIPSNLHNQFGGSVGGPVFKDRLFFFGDYQGLREKTGTSTITTVPTARTLSSCTSGGDCDLSDYLAVSASNQAYDPRSNPNSPAGRTPFPGNIIPQSQLSAPAINLLKLLPAPNSGGPSAITNNYVASGTGGFNNDQFDARGDYRSSAKLHLFGRYTRFTSDLNGGAYFGAAGGPGFANGFAGTDNAAYQSLAAGADYSLSAKWLTDIRFGWYRLHLNQAGPGSNQPLGNNLGIPNTNVGDLALNGGLPQFAIDVPSNGSNGSSVITYGTTTNQSLQDSDQYQIVNNWTYARGSHNIKFGVDLRYALNHIVSVQNNYLRSGLYSFHASTTSGTAAGEPAESANPGLGWASFVLGDINSFTRSQTFSTSAAERQKRAFFYVQDQWRITPKLTFNYGVRDELYFPETVNGRGRGGLLDLTGGVVRIAGYGPWGTNLNVEKSWTTIAPRVGLAYQATPGTVVRAGYGRVFGQGWSGNTYGLVLTASYPIQYVQNLNQISNFTPLPFNLRDGPPAATAPSIPSNGSFVLPDGILEATRPLYVRLPTLDAWNAAVQQTLTPTMSLQLGYVASHAVHNMFDSSNQADVNQQTIAGYNACPTPVVFNGTTCTPASINPLTGAAYTQNDRRPYYNGTAQALGVRFGTPHGWSQSFRYNANQATSTYQALQVTLDKRFSQGLQFLSHYTWAKALAHESNYFFIDPRADVGPSYYNRRHVFLFSGNYELPFGRNHAFGASAPGWVNQAIGGFTVNGTLTWESGLPFTPRYASCGSDQDVDTGGSLCRPNKTSLGPQLQSGSLDPINHRVRYFMTAPNVLANNESFGAFQRPSFGTFGDFGRDSLPGPGLFNTDFSAAKSFSIRESTKLQFRAEAFNVFNHVNLGGPNNCVDCQDGNSGYIFNIVASQDGTSMRRLQFAVRVEF